jgi:hypothetical protein
MGIRRVNEFQACTLITVSFFSQKKNVKLNRPERLSQYPLEVRKVRLEKHINQRG